MNAVDPRIARFYAFAETQGAKDRVADLETIAEPSEPLPDDLLPYYARLTADPRIQFAYGVRVNPGDTQSQWSPHVDLAHNLEIARVAAGCWALDRYEPRLPAAAINLNTGARIAFSPTPDELAAYTKRAADRRIASAYAAAIIKGVDGCRARAAESLGISESDVGETLDRLSVAAIERTVRPRVGDLLEHGSEDLLGDLIEVCLPHLSPEQVLTGYEAFEAADARRKEIAAAALLSLVPRHHVDELGVLLTEDERRVATIVRLEDKTISDAAAHLGRDPADVTREARMAGQKLRRIAFELERSRDHDYTRQSNKSL